MFELDAETARQRRLAMVEEQIRRRGITDSRVLEVMVEIPRERFLPPDCAEIAYDDRAACIGCDQTISQPYMVALMTASLRLEPWHRVLEVGTGSGYQTAILSRLAADVYTVERIPALLDGARERLDGLGCKNVHYLLGDGSLGWPQEAPFDRIIVTAGAPALPPALHEQTAEGGRIVIPIGGEAHQTLVTVDKLHQRTVETPGVACRFVQLIGRQGWPGGVVDDRE